MCQDLSQDLHYKIGVVSSFSGGQTGLWQIFISSESDTNSISLASSKSYSNN